MNRAIYIYQLKISLVFMNRAISIYQFKYIFINTYKSHPKSSAMACALSLRDEDRKFSRSQNVTGMLQRFTTLNIITFETITTITDSDET